MSLNLISLLGNVMDGGFVKNAAQMLGESEDKTANAVKGIVPTLLGTVLNQSKSASGLGSLFSMITGGGGGQAPGAGLNLSNLAGMFSGGGGQAQNLITQGGGMLQGLLGDKLGGITSALSAFSGVSSGNTGKLLGLAAPVVMGMLGKQVKDSGLNASGFASMLAGQENFIKQAMPSGLGSALQKFGVGSVLGNLGGLAQGAASAVSGAASAVGGAVGQAGDYARGAAGAAGHAAAQAASGGGSILGKLIPIVILALGGMWLFKNCSAKNAVDATRNAAQNAANAVQGALQSVSLPGGGTLDIAKGSMEEGLLGFLRDGAAGAKQSFSLESLNLQGNSLSADAAKKFGVIGTLLKNFMPSGLQVKGAGDGVVNFLKSQLVNLGLPADKIGVDPTAPANAAPSLELTK